MTAPTPPQASTAAAANGKPKAPKAPKEPKVKAEGAGRRSNLAAQYPNDAKITMVAESNPKREGSKAHARFQLYSGVKTVGEYLAKSTTFEGEELKGTYTDLAYNVGRGYIKVG